jgi:hypothetical protein
MFLDAINVKRLGGRRATEYQLMTVAEVGYELFTAAIYHPDATEKFLDEARGEFGPLVDTALYETGSEYYRRDPAASDETYHRYPY